MEILKRLNRLVFETLRHWVNDDGMTESAALAYYAILSLPALLLFSFSIGGIFISRSDLGENIARYVGEIAGSEAGDLISKLLLQVPDVATLRIGAIIGFVFVLGSASKMFSQIKKAFNKMWGVTTQKNWFEYYLLKKVTSIATVFIFGFLLMAGVIIEAVYLFFSGFISTVMPFFPDISGHAASISNFIVFVLFFMFVYRVLLDVDIPLKYEFVGSLFTVTFITLSKIALSIYLSNTSIYTLYGAMGSFLGILLWVYYNFCVITIGAEFTKVYRDMDLELESSEKKKYAIFKSA